MQPTNYLLLDDVKEYRQYRIEQEYLVLFQYR